MLMRDGSDSAGGSAEAAGAGRLLGLRLRVPEGHPVHGPPDTHTPHRGSPCRVHLTPTHRRGGGPGYLSSVFT